MKLSTRLSAAFGAILAILATVTAIGLAQLWEIRLLQDEVAEHDHLAELAARWRGETNVNLTRTLAIAKSGGLQSLSDYLQPLIKQTSQGITDIQKQVKEAT